jgi:hypothetical protein
LDACSGNIDIASYVQEARCQKQEARSSRGGALPHPFNVSSLSYYDAMVGESVVGDDAHIALNGRLSEVS